MIGSGSRGIPGEMGRIRSLSSRIEARMRELGPAGGPRIDRLTYEELQDLAKVVGIADFMVAKHAENREMSRILGEFAAIIRDAAGSLGSIDDEISELILSAEDSIGRVREMHARIHERSDVCSSPINLTNSVAQINPPKYQQNPQGHSR